MQVSVGGLILAVLAVGAGAVCCWVRSGRGRWERPAACSLIALSAITVLFACVVVAGGQLWARGLFAALCVVVTCVVYVVAAKGEVPPLARTVSARSLRHTARPAARPPVFTPLPEKAPAVADERPIPDRGRPAASSGSAVPAAHGSASCCMMACDHSAAPAPVPQPVVPVLKLDSARVPAAAQVPAPVPELAPPAVTASGPEAAAKPASRPTPASRPKLASAPAPAPVPPLVLGSGSSPATAVDRPAKAACGATTESCLSKARSFKDKGELPVAARLFKDAARRADCSERRSIQFEELSCYVKAGLADRALALAEELRASSGLTAFERTKLDAVARML